VITKEEWTHGVNSDGSLWAHLYTSERPTPLEWLCDAMSSQWIQRSHGQMHVKTWREWLRGLCFWRPDWRRY